ncbi:HU family DNA-binding protein [Candidatus Trichorickettsia mobilis]|uniref:HU family DNA-binding protein n=1 Tax=Candidatus Trichorickettsia mobilis TaxID=1346319 RepID=A0ABZ0USW0_9RICK|nr:HU family DNA-binding protein [Candidatus Trichorickettsia mobilis]WPY00177.1 HU family DNA-binding protein [Candidatus Trichorickettsia mobilis]
MATKNDLIEALSKEISYLSKEDSSEVVNLVLEYLTEMLVQHNKIEIRGFGSFSIRSRKYANSNKLYNTVYYRMAKNVMDSTTI